MPELVFFLILLISFIAGFWLIGRLVAGGGRLAIFLVMRKSRIEFLSRWGGKGQAFNLAFLFFDTASLIAFFIPLQALGQYISVDMALPFLLFASFLLFSCLLSGWAGLASLQDTPARPNLLKIIFPVLLLAWLFYSFWFLAFAPPPPDFPGFFPAFFQQKIRDYLIDWFGFNFPLLPFLTSVFIILSGLFFYNLLILLSLKSKPFPFHHILVTLFIFALSAGFMSSPHNLPHNLWPDLSLWAVIFILLFEKKDAHFYQRQILAFRAGHWQLLRHNPLWLWLFGGHIFFIFYTSACGLPNGEGAFSEPFAFMLISLSILIRDIFILHIARFFNLKKADGQALGAILFCHILPFFMRQFFPESEISPWALSLLFLLQPLILWVFLKKSWRRALKRREIVMPFSLH